MNRKLMEKVPNKHKTKNKFHKSWMDAKLSTNATWGTEEIWTQYNSEPKP